MRKFNRNYLFGIGTLGRDMVYALTAMYLMYFLTDVMDLSVRSVGIVTVIMMILRVFDAFNDPFMGLLIDNTKSKYGKFKPWILSGAITSCIVTILLFTDFKVGENAYLVIFTIIYLLWDITYTAHDIGYWSMIPSLSRNSSEREKIGSFARICSDIGIFTVVVGIVPITEWLKGITGSLKSAWFIFACVVSILMVIFIVIMCLVVKEDRKLDISTKQTKVKDIFKTIIGNDQLLWIVISMVLFTIAYNTTTSFGIYYFEYVFGDKDVYSIFAIVLAVSQLTSIGSFPYLSKIFGRKKMYLVGTILVTLGYIVFGLFENLFTVSAGGVLIFAGEGFIQILMLMFIADCVEYGQWKSGKRNDSITLSIQPFITKLGSAVAAGVVGLTVVITRLKDKTGPMDLSSSDILFFKNAMITLPLILIIISYIIYSKKFIIDEKKFNEIVKDLENINSKEVE